MLLQFRQKNRRFVCRQCGKNASDRPQPTESKDSNVEIELLDLCDNCFKIYKKEVQQAYILVDLVQKGKVSQDEMKHLTDLRIAGHQEAFKKFRTKLLRRNENTKGFLKFKKQLMIKKLLNRNKET